MKKYDVVALGELLIDFTEAGVSEQGNKLFEANPGGAPCNVLAMIAKMGYKPAFIGKVGDDAHGKYLRDMASNAGIDLSALSIDKNTRTTLAFVSKNASGDREFSFYRNPGADVMLTEDEVDESMIKDTRIFHFGSLSMTHEGVRAASKKAIKAAKEAGVIRSFDPNLRPLLWDSDESARANIAYGMEHCDILKISDNEIQWFTGKDDYDEGVAYLKSHYDIKLILLSMGPDGSRAYFKDERVEVKPFLLDNTVETTGAGDTFMASCLGYVLKNGLEDLTAKNLEDMLTFANAAAAIVTTRYGALKVMPEVCEVEALINSYTER